MNRLSVRARLTGLVVLVALVLGVVVWSLFYVWAMIHRFRVGWLERELRVGDLDLAIEQRRAEAHAGIDGGDR